MHTCNSPGKGMFAGRNCFHVKSAKQGHESETQISTDADALGHVISKGRPAESQPEKYKKCRLLECLAKWKFQKEDMNK